MGLQSFLSHAQDDPGTQEAIRKLLEKDQPPPPQRFLSSEPSIAPPIRTIDASQPPPVAPELAGAPEYQPTQAEIAPPVRSILPEPTDAPLNLSPPPPVRVGTSLSGLDPIEAAQARLRATQGANPQSRIDASDPNFVDVAAPHKISRLKAMGRLFLENLKRGGIVGGLIGAGEGLVSPGHAQDLQHQQEVGGAQQNLDQTIENQKNIAQVQDIQAQAEQRRNPPMKYHEPVIKDVLQPDGSTKRMQSSDYGQTWQEQGALRGAPPIRTTAPHVQWVENADGSKSAFTPDPKNPSGPWIKAGLPDAAVPPDRTSQSEEYQTAKANAERKAKADAANQSALAAEAAGNDHLSKVSKAAAGISTLDNQMRAMPANVSYLGPDGKTVVDGQGNPKLQPNPALGPLKRQRAALAKQQDEEQKAADTAFKERDKHKGMASEFSQPLPAPPRRAIYKGLSEKQIRDAATAAGLDPDKAVERAKGRK